MLGSILLEADNGNVMTMGGRRWRNGFGLRLRWPGWPKLRK